MNLKVKIRRLKDGKAVFIVDIPLRCRNCKAEFKTSLQVGIAYPRVFCPFCFSFSFLHLKWHFNQGKLKEGSPVRIVVADF